MDEHFFTIDEHANVGNIADEFDQYWRSSLPSNRNDYYDEFQRFEIAYERRDYPPQRVEFLIKCGWWPDEPDALELSPFKIGIRARIQVVKHGPYKPQVTLMLNPYEDEDDPRFHAALRDKKVNDIFNGFRSWLSDMGYVLSNESAMDEPVKPSTPKKPDSIEPRDRNKWFDYYHECHRAGIKYTLADLANDINISYVYARNLHINYKLERGI